jgi:hypothetical protein
MKEESKKNYDDYYSNLAEKLPQNFFKNIIEKENLVQLSSNPSEEAVSELGSLYKKAIEIYSNVSKDKVIFYSNKLSKLLIGAQKAQKKKEQKPSNWSKYFDAKKKHTNKFMLFFEINKYKGKVGNIVDKSNKNLNVGNKQIISDLIQQETNFLEKKNKKKTFTKEDIHQRKDSLNVNRNSINNIINNNEENKKKEESPKKKKLFSQKNDKIDSLIKDFIKKFQYSYLNSPIFEAPLKTISEIFDEIYENKIQNYYEYQNQIKGFEMLLNDKQAGDEDDENLQYYITDLKNEREKYYQQIEETIVDLKKDINKKCAQISIDEEANIKKYKIEFLKKIAKIFQ